MKAMIFICLLATSLFGCAPYTRLVNTFDNTNKLNAPINQRNIAGGTVKYDYDREGAYFVMKNYCKGDYRITNEYVAHEQIPYTINMQHFTYLEFECAEKESK